MGSLRVLGEGMAIREGREVDRSQNHRPGSYRNYSNNDGKPLKGLSQGWNNLDIYMFCENGAVGAQGWGRQRRSKQRKLWRSCQYSRKKQAESFHGSLKKTASQYGQRGDESKCRCYARQIRAEKWPVGLARWSLLVTLIGSQFGGVVEESMEGEFIGMAVNRIRWEVCLWEERQRNGKKARGDSGSREDDIKVCLYAHWNDSRKGGFDNAREWVITGLCSWCERGWALGLKWKVSLSRNEVTSFAAEYVDWLRQMEITFMFTVLAFTWSLCAWPSSSFCVTMLIDLCNIFFLSPGHVSHIQICLHVCLFH